MQCVLKQLSQVEEAIATKNIFCLLYFIPGISTALFLLKALHFIVGNRRQEAHIFYLFTRPKN